MNYISPGAHSKAEVPAGHLAAVDARWLPALFACNDDPLRRRITHEALVELQIVDRKAFQVTKRGIAGSEVAHGDFDFHLAHGIALEAKRLLAHSTASVAEVAYQLGFSEATNFVRFFRKHVDIPPAGFRRAMSQNR